MNYKLEVIVLPVTDVDRARSFYVDKLGFSLDADTVPAPDFRVVHMTPPGSNCSVVVGPVRYDPADPPATRARFQLVVTDLPAARKELAERGVETSEIQELSPLDGGSFAYLADPDGNEWAIQEIRDHVGAEL
jgi:catechol 2,3-dioxygenase-like lactoylglutathione lyase family enzyme